MKATLIFITLVAFAAATPTIKERWASFKAQHGKSYDSIEEEQRRMAIFLEKEQMIEEHNAKYEAGLSTYYLGMNQFGDMLPEEVAGLGYHATGDMMDVPSLAFVPPANGEINSTVDWKAYGAVTDVRKQGDCESDWAFSIVGAIEGQLFINTGKLESLSAQQLIDCSKKIYKNKGCKGGSRTKAAKYLRKVEGLETDGSYEYEGKDGKCNYSRKKAVPGTKVKTYNVIKAERDNELLAAVSHVGPVTALIKSSGIEYLHYKGGLFEGETCTGRVNHAILVVGYGIDEGKKYWLLKNSLGSEWGDGGYMKLTREKKNACGISTSASYVTLYKN